jgi:hypothetical protein
VSRLEHFPSRSFNLEGDEASCGRTRLSFACRVRLAGKSFRFKLARVFFHFTLTAQTVLSFIDNKEQNFLPSRISRSPAFAGSVSNFYPLQRRLPDQAEHMEQNQKKEEKILNFSTLVSRKGARKGFLC